MVVFLVLSFLVPSLISISFSVSDATTRECCLSILLNIPRQKFYIFGYDIIHNSSINTVSHFLSVCRTFLTFSSPSTFILSSQSPWLPGRCFSPFLCHACHSRRWLCQRCGSQMIYGVVQCSVCSIDCVSEAVICRRWLG